MNGKSEQKYFEWSQPEIYVGYINQNQKNAGLRLQPLKSQPVIWISDEGIHSIWGNESLIKFPEIDYIYFSELDISGEKVKLMNIIDQEPSSSTFCLSKEVDISKLMELFKTKGINIEKNKKT